MKAVCKDPGGVPPNWGFYMGDEVKRRRYCKFCNVWKPDRTHHCSVCGRCILNMDHHCPWINNCVGFYNRKFFIQLLIYSLICLLFVAIQGLHYLFIYSMANVSNELEAAIVFQYIYVCLMVFISLVLLFTLIPFLKFHLILVLKNLTTIENMDSSNREHRRFDLGIKRNITQVFGTNALCWLTPCQIQSSRPAGDGVRWHMHYTSASDEDLEHDLR
ncbi:DHHC zinc finger domain-containing protein [Cardiosporidium cionae]|uniref:Palmitoyltransferase n=1 Tax=Cardiosporidium cionae TaxID=476202 RepID=A0ABQ7J5D3_9APIC|nr:DHHC zinc finger domain-containing protein [Cardiosporidium cionae]|eukprot:KAF8819187.1 DHHC zinc finger domain-containing protein [Cardiosporidium cionae]